MKGSSMEFLLPLGIILLGVVAMTIYVLVVALRDATRQIVQTNKQLLVLLGSRDGGEAVGRALVASARPPLRPVGGLAQDAKKPTKKKSEPPQGLTMKMGAN